MELVWPGKMIIQGKNSLKNNYNPNLHYLKTNCFPWPMFKYVCEGRGGERVKGVREVMSNTTDFQEKIRRLRRGGGCCER